MNAMKTATAAGAAAVLTPIVAYIASQFGQKLPPDVLSSVVVLIVTGAHWLGDFLTAYAAKRNQGATQ